MGAYALQMVGAVSELVDRPSSIDAIALTKVVQDMVFASRFP